MEIQWSAAPGVTDFCFLRSCADKEDWTRFFDTEDEDASELLGKKYLRSSLKQGSLSERQYAIFAEQGRRRRMKFYCTQLSFLLPNAKPQTDRGQLYDEAVRYIKELDEQIEHLTAKKHNLLKIHRLRQASAMDTMNVNVFIFAREVSIAVHSPRKPRSISKLLQEIENQNMDIETFQMFSYESTVSCCFHVLIRGEDLMLEQNSTKDFLQDTVKRVY